MLRDVSAKSFPLATGRETNHWITWSLPSNMRVWTYPFYTYIRLNRGWMYLVAVLDWYSRYVVSWELDQTLEMPFVLAAVDRALATGTPRIWNND